jgi:hypothetical protein
MDIESAFERKFISAVDLPDQGDVAVTIRKVTIEAIEQRDGTKAKKPIVELERPLLPDGPTRWPLNRTNARAIKQLIGSGDPEAWAGRSLSLYKTEVQVGPDLKDAVRVRKSLPGASSIAAEHVLTDEDQIPF